MVPLATGAPDALTTYLAAFAPLFGDVCTARSFAAIIRNGPGSTLTRAEGGETPARDRCGCGRAMTAECAARRKVIHWNRRSGWWR